MKNKLMMLYKEEVKIDENASLKELFQKMVIDSGLPVEEKIVQDILRFYVLYPEKEGNLEEIAESFSLNKDYFGRIFKKQTGKSYHQFLRTFKMEKAKYLLKNSHYKTYEISGFLGYKSVDYFEKVFKNHTGISPTQYKKSEI